MARDFVKIYEQCLMSSEMSRRSKPSATMATNGKDGSGSQRSAYLWLALFILVLNASWAVYYYQFERLPSPVNAEQAGEQGFSEVSAMAHVKFLSELGPHSVASDALDVALQVIDCLICRFCRMMSYEKEKYESFLIFRPWFYESLIGNDKETIRREFGRFSLSSYEKAETLLFPILTLGHWHLLVLVKAQNKWVHYSPHITMSCYVNDAFSFSRRLGTYLWEMWGIEYVGSWPMTLKDELPHKDDNSLDCGIIMLEYIRAIVFGDKGVNGDEVYMVDQSICANLRAGYAADLITEGTYYEGTLYDTDFEVFQTIVGPAQVDAIRRVTEMYA